MNKKIGIILVNYNGYNDTIECIKSLQQADSPERIIIVVDNCSTDDSVELFKKKEIELNFVLLCESKNKGFSSGNNVGIRYAFDHGCTHFLLLNNDTIVTKSFLSEMFKHDDGESVLTGTILYYFDTKRVWYAGGKVSRITGKTVHLKMDSTIAELEGEAKDVSFVSGCEMLLPKKVITKVGLMDEDYFLYSEDVDYSLRIAKHGFRMIYVPSSVIYHKVSASTSKISKATQYYSARNRRILIYRNFNCIQRAVALIFTNIQSIYRIIDGRQSVKCVKAGIVDYYKKRFGKTTRTFE